MRLTFTLCLLVVFSFSYAQIEFEPGYFIDNSGIKTECLIKNYEWKNNPDEIEYKLNDAQESMIAPISSVSAFEILNASKYIRAKVQIDRSSDQLSKLSSTRQSEFSEEVLFLKVLIEGRANLYSYEDRNLTRFFYQTDEIPILQLEYKRYSVDASSIATNARFRHQLRTTVSCKNSELKNVDNLKYLTNSLVKYFIAYNECTNEAYKSYLKKKEPITFINVSVKTGIDYATFKLKASDFDTNETFDAVISPRVGLEAEFVLPFNKNKWAVVIEPTYQNYQTEETISYTYNTPSKRSASVDYASIELPIGIRHYFFLSKEAKLFINAFFLLDFELESSIDIEHRDPKAISSSNSFGFGAGYQYKRLGMELRHSTRRDLLENDMIFGAYYSKSSLVLGYKLF